MNEVHVNEWVAALRITQAPQIVGTLVNEVQVGDAMVPGFCCLGIGQKVAGIELHAPDWSHESWAFSEGTDLPGREFLDWLGVVGTDGVGDADVVVAWPADLLDREGFPYLPDPTSGGGLTCATLNDGLRLTFPQIADLVAYFGVR